MVARPDLNWRPGALRTDAPTTGPLAHHSGWKHIFLEHDPLFTVLDCQFMPIHDTHCMCGLQSTFESHTQGPLIPETDESRIEGPLGPETQNLIRKGRMKRTLLIDAVCGKTTHLPTCWDGKRRGSMVRTPKVKSLYHLHNAQTGLELGTHCCAGACPTTKLLAHLSSAMLNSRGTNALCGGRRTV